MVNGSVVFDDRKEAGRKLAEKMKDLKDTAEDIVIIGLPRGGVPVAAEIARELGAPLDVIVLKKLGAPGRPELAVGALSESGDMHLNQDVIKNYGVKDDYLEKIKQKKMEEIEEQASLYREACNRIPLKGKSIILVDDGIATGATMKSAIASIKNEDPAQLIVAVPVAPKDTLDKIEEKSERVVCLHPESGFFGGVGAYYRDFSQTPTEKVAKLLRNQ